MQDKPKCYVLVFDFRGVKNPPSSHFEIRVFANEGKDYKELDCEGSYVNGYDCISCYLDLTLSQVKKFTKEVIDKYSKDFDVVVREFTHDVGFDSVYESLQEPKFDY